MNLTQAAKEMVKDVADTQQKSFRTGRARVKQVAEAPTSQLVPESVDAYRVIMKYNLQTQTKLGDKMVKTLTTVEGFPAPMKEPATRLQDMAHELVESSAKWVDGLCDALIELYPDKAMDSVGKALGDPICKVREAAVKIVTLDKEWVEVFANKASDVSKTAPRPTTSKKRAPTKKKTTAKKKTAAKKTAVPKKKASA